MRLNSPVSRVLCAGVALCLASCTIQPVPNGAGGASGATGAGGAADAAMLVRQEKAFETATATHGADGWVSFFNDSSASFQPGQLIQIGQEAERRNITGALPDTSDRLQWKPTYSVMAQSGDLGYTYGYYRLRAHSVKANAKAGANIKVEEHTGAYVTIWRRQADSGWKVAVDIGTPGPIPPGFFDSTAGIPSAH